MVRMWEPFTYVDGIDLICLMLFYVKFLLLVYCISCNYTIGIILIITRLISHIKLFSLCLEDRSDSQKAGLPSETFSQQDDIGRDKV